MTKNEFINELKAYIPAYLSIKMNNSQTYLQVFLKGDQVLAIRYNSKNNIGCGCFKYAEKNVYTYSYDTYASLDEILALYKTAWLPIIKELKALNDKYSNDSEYALLLELGFEKLNGNGCYRYKQAEVEIEVRPFDLGRNTVAPFTLIVTKGREEKLREYFSALDALLDFIVNGGE